MSKRNDPIVSVENKNIKAKALAKIELAEIETGAAEEIKDTHPQSSSGLDHSSLMDATRSILRQHGIRKSVAAVNEAVEKPHENFTPPDAASALSNLGFKSSFGGLKFSQISPELFPLIALMNNGKSILLLAPEEDKKLKSVETSGKGNIIYLNSEQFQQEFSGYVVLAKELNDSEKAAQTGHWFFSAFRKSKWIYVQVMIAAMVSNFLSLSTSLFTMTVYDRIIPNGAFESLIALSIGVIIALGFDFLIKSLRARFIDIASKRADLEISRKLFDRILSLSPTEQRQKTGAMAGIVREFESLREFFNSSTLVILIDLPFVFFFIYVIYLIAGPIAYVPLFAVPLVILVGLGIQPFLAKITKGSVESGMNKQAVLVETLNGLETVSATGSGKLMKKRYEHALNNQSTSGNKIRGLSMFMVNFAASVQQYAQIAMIFYGVYLIVAGTITQGALIGAVILGGRTMGPLSQLASTMSRANGALTSYRNINKLIGEGFNNSSKLSPISRPNFTGEIEFRNVSFKFDGDGPYIIKNLSFKIPAGQKVALIGKMGSGKSTFSRLIAGLYEPTEGAILVDGIDVRQIDPADTRKNIGVMMQESWLFSGSVRENIQMGFNEYDDEHLLRVCKIAGVDDFVGSDPKGYDLQVRESGKGLSGGQRQTINLARSLLHDPSILLLDEPTSSLDQASEAKIVNELRDACKDKTMIIVTHRNPILAIVDRVFIFENGTIVADQTPEQLGVKKV